MATTMPYFIGDACLTANHAQLAFDHFVHNLPGVAPLVIASAFNDLLTAIRHPYTVRHLESDFERRVRDAEVARLQKELHLASSQLQPLQYQLQETEIERRTLHDQLQAAQIERHNLQDQLQTTQIEQRTLHDQFQTAQNERRTLYDQLQAAQNERRTLHDQLQAAQNKRQMLQGQIQALQAELQSCQIHFEAEIKSTRNEATAAIATLEGRAKDSTSSNKAMVENLESQIAFLRREVLLLRTNATVDTTGSKSRSETWTKVKNANPDGMSLPLAVCPSLPAHHNFAVDQLVADNYPTEKDMYRPFVSVVGSILNIARTADNLGTAVIDTHNRQYLGVYSPDITVAIGGLKHPDSASVYMVIELKHTSVLLEGKGLGQAYDYTLALRAAQGHRRLHVVMLSNFLDTHFVLLDTADWTTRHFIATSLSHAISYIKHRVLHSHEFSPQVPAYSLSLGDMVRRLGTTKHSVIAEFDAPGAAVGTLGRLFPKEKLGTTMAVKRSSDPAKAGDIAHEIKILTKIRMNSGINTIARLVHASPDNDELGVMPVGQRVDSEMSEHTAITILTDILNAIEWLHSKSILHRDVRIDNVVMYEGRARLIDFGAAIELPAEPGTPYWGGYLCCPPELIGDFSLPYTPEKRHDLLAFVLMAALMAFPHSIKSMSSKEVSQHTPESSRLKRYWARLKTSSVWRPYYVAAEAGHYGGLRTIGDVFAIL